MAILKPLILAIAATALPGALGYQLRPRDAISNDPYPFCNPATNPNCIEDGKYLVPQLDFSLEGDVGDLAYKQYLPTHTFTVSQWTNGKMPERCYFFGVTADYWNPADFVMYNVTFSDCTGTPFVVCWHSRSSKTISQIATELGRIPATMRQATSVYMVYPDDDDNTENPNYGGLIATSAADGMIIGRGRAYFATSLIHEFGHAVDSTLASPDAVHPWYGTSFSSTPAWQAAADADGYAVSAYGAGSYSEDFADTGRAVLLDAIYPGGLAAWAGNNPNLTQITHQLAAFKAVAGSFYTVGGTCDPALKFPFPTLFVNVAVPTTTTTTSSANTAIAGPYGQCGGWSTYTGPTACGVGYSCSTVNSYYAQCTPA